MYFMYIETNQTELSIINLDSVLHQNGPACLQYSQYQSAIAFGGSQGLMDGIQRLHRLEECPLYWGGRGSVPQREEGDGEQ